MKHKQKPNHFVANRRTTVRTTTQTRVNRSRNLNNTAARVDTTYYYNRSHSIYHGIIAQIRNDDDGNILDGCVP